MLQLIITILGGALIFWANRRAPLLFFLIVFGLFWWGYTAFSMSDKMLAFYLFGLMFYMITKLTIGVDTQHEGDWRYEIKTFALGGVLFAMAYSLSSVKGQIMGVASLAIDNVTTWQSKVTVLFSPLISGTLGIIENSVWISALMILMATGTFLFFLPYILTALTFGLFHVVAYSLQWTTIIWASIMMGLMISSYLITGKDMTAMNFFHFSWNSWLTSKETLSIMF